MNITDIYTKKEYTCKKCNGQVYYGKVTDESGKIVTKDGAWPNGKFGKESNVLSAAVDSNNKTKFHECYLSNVQQQYRDALRKLDPASLAERPVVNNMPDVSKDTLRAKDTEAFLTEWNDIYVRAQPLISKHCGPEASVKDKHIATCGLIHDYFQNKSN